MNWKAVVYPLLIILALGGIYLFFVFKHRQEPTAAERQAAQQSPSGDEIAIDRQEFPQHFDDVQELAGKSVWMRNGYSMPYFAYEGGKVNWAKQAGVLAPVEKLDVKKAIKAPAPASVSDHIPHGSHQVLLVFTLAGSDAQYATPVGAEEGQQEQYFDDLLFFYDDPHTIYAKWPKDTWAAIDAHQPKQGMNELQMSLVLGQNVQTDSQNKGDRTITYDVNGKKTAVTFANDKATTIQAQ